MNLPKKPGAARSLRLLSVGFGIIVLVWLSVEDQSVTWVILFAAAICLLTAAWFLASSPHPVAGKGWLVYPLTGLLGGAATAPVALLLMAIKTGLHGHSVPDYSPNQMMALLISFPIWVGAGGAIGLGAGLWLKNR